MGALCALSMWKAGHPPRVIDYFALGLTHALLALAFFRLVGREELDREDGDAIEPDSPVRPGDRRA